MLCVRLRLALAALARQIQVIDYVDPPLAVPLEASLRTLENLLAQLPAALAADSRRQRTEDDAS